MTIRRLLGALALVVVTSGTGSLQTGPQIRIVTPQPADYISGDTTIRIAVDPATAQVSSLDISVDGVPVCKLPAATLECRFNAGTELRRRVIRAVARFATGERAVHTISTSAVDVNITTGVEAVLVAVSVQDDRRRFVQGLSQDRFRLFESGKPQTITFFAPEGWPCEIVLAIDVSGSMAKSLPAVRRAARAFIAAVGAEDHVTVAAFSTSFAVLAPRTASASARAASLERLVAAGGTALFDALLSALEQLEGRDGRKAIVVFSDGEDKSSAAALEHVERRLLSEDVVLYVVGHGDASKLPALRGTLSRVAEATGGDAVFLDDADDAEKAFGRILDDVKHQYTLGFAPAADGPAGWRPLRVDVAGGRYRVRARQGYVPQTPPGR